MPRSPLRKRMPEVHDVDARYVIGKEEALDKVTAWLEKVSASPEVEGDIQITLAQAGVGTPRVLATFPFSPGEQEQIVSVAEEIVDHAEDAGEDIATGQGKVRFTISAPEHLRGQQGFTLEFPPSSDEDFDVIPDETGIVSQALQQVQFFATFAKDVFKTTLADKRVEAHEMRAELRDASRHRLDTIKIFAELYDAKFERDLTMKRAAIEEDRKEKVVGTLMAGVPAVMNKFLGQGTVPGNTSFENLMMGFMSTFDGEQLKQLSQTGQIQMTQTQLHAFGELFKTALERDEQSKAMLEEIKRRLSDEAAQKQGETPPPAGGKKPPPDGAPPASAA